MLSKCGAREGSWETPQGDQISQSSRKSALNIYRKDWHWSWSSNLELDTKLHFDHLIQRADSLEKTLVLGSIEGRRRRGWQRMRWLDGIINSMNTTLSKLQERVKEGSLACCSLWGHKESDVTEAEQQHDTGLWVAPVLNHSVVSDSLWSHGL